jgi:hypothetical protein
MTEPDEATLWARENAAKQCDRDREPRIAAAYRQGQYDDDHLKADAEAYRAGQAASAERIKALEEVTQNLIAMFDCDDPEVSARAWDEALDEARALLKEADQ